MINKLTFLLGSDDIHISIPVVMRRRLVTAVVCHSSLSDCVSLLAADISPLSILLNGSDCGILFSQLSGPLRREEWLGKCVMLCVS